MPRNNGYVALAQLSDSRPRGIPDRSRALIRAENAEGLPWSDRGDHDHGLVGDTCCVPSGEATATRWKWVGEGRGSYAQSDRYAFVGDGRGDFDPQWTASKDYGCCAFDDSSIGSLCCCCFWTLLLGLVGTYLAMNFCQEAIGVFGGILGRSNEVVGARHHATVEWAPSTTVYFRPPPFRCDGVDEAVLAAWPREQQDWCCLHAGIGCPPYDCQAETTNWRRSWSAEKQRWCCAKVRLGCPQTPSDTYDCEAGLSNSRDGWSQSKQHWCCEHEGKGCSTSLALPFDCSAGYTNWEAGWSQEKKDWCCRHQSRGCGPRAPDVDALCQGTSAPLRREVADWCCRIHNRLCPAGQPAFDCSAEWHGHWSEAKQAWCCVHRKLGCPLNCTGEVGSWSAAKRISCCAYESLGCPAGGVAGLLPPPPALFECEEPNREGWSKEQRLFCCRARPGIVKCPHDGSHSSSLPYDCNAGAAHWRAGWSEGKKEWCCMYAGQGCEHVAEGDEYDCTAGYVNWERGWSDDKKAWCCEHRDRGCSSRDSPPRTTSQIFDCDAGFSDWEQGWSKSKRSWCCKHSNRGCMPKYHCDTAEHAAASWSDEHRAWCCAHEHRGCAREVHLSAELCHAEDEHVESTWTVEQRDFCCTTNGRGCERSQPAPPLPPHVLKCANLNCFGEGAQAVELPGAVGRGDAASLRGVSLPECRDACSKTRGCDGVVFKDLPNGAPEERRMCYGKKSFTMSKCQRADGYVAEVLNSMPWGQCAIVGDPHIWTWDRVLGQAVVMTDPGDFWLVKSQPLNIVGRFGFTDRFPKASSAIGLAVTGSQLSNHRLIFEYIGPAQGYAGFKASWDGLPILTMFPSHFRSPDGVLTARLANMDPSKFHREGRHTIGGTGGLLPSYVFELSALSIYALLGPDNCNLVITTRKIESGQDGFCGNFNCDQEDDSMDHLQKRGVAAPLPLAQSLFPDPPQAPRAKDVPFGERGSPPQD